MLIEEELKVLINDINKIETQLQLMQEEYMYYEQENKFYKKLEKVNFIDTNNIELEIIEKLKKEYLDINLKWDEEYIVIKKLNEKIEKLQQTYNEKINAENHEKIKFWIDEREKRNDKKIELIYNMKKKELNRQEKFVKVFSVIRNLALSFAIAFLILRNFIFEDFMDKVAGNFSILSVVLIIAVFLTSFIKDKNKKEFEVVENNYMSNLNMIYTLNLNIKKTFIEAGVLTKEDYENKLIENTKIYDEIYSLEMDKFNLKKKINPIRNKKHEINSKFYNVITALDVNFSPEHIEECMEEFKMELEVYNSFKEKREIFMNKYKKLWEEYRNKNRVCVDALYT